MVLSYGSGIFEVAAALQNISACQIALSFFSQNLQVMLMNHLLVQQHDLQNLHGILGCGRNSDNNGPLDTFFIGLKVPLIKCGFSGQYKPRWVPLLLVVRFQECA